MKKFIVLGLDGATPSIIDEYIQKGLLVNFKRLRDKGAFGINVPFPSSVTPGNWAAIASGSYPGTNGISDFYVHIPGETFEKSHDPFYADMCKAELMWDALSRQGLKVATMNYPCSRPVTSELHTSIGDNGMPSENSLEYTISPARLFLSENVKLVCDREWEKEYEDVVLNKDTSWANMPNGYNVIYDASIAVEAKNENCLGAYDYFVSVVKTNDGIVTIIATDRDYNKKVAVLNKFEWSDWINKEFSLKEKIVCAGYRFRVIKAEENGEFQLYLSIIYPTVNFSEPLEVGASLYNKLGQYSDCLNISKLCMGWLDPEGLMDEFKQQGVWQAKAALELINNHSYAGVFAKWHAFDKYYHFLFDKIDPVSPCFIPDEFEYYENIHKELLKISDEMVGIILDGMDEDTTLVVISDHGLMPSQKLAWVNNFLAKNGYIKTKIDENGKEVIDYKNTKAIMRPFVILWINLKGRDPEGCVLPEEYDELCNEIVEKLTDWKDEETGKHVLAEVFKINHGAFYGLWGERDGDIRIHTQPGYTLYRSQYLTPDRVLVSPSRGSYRGDHGSCMPTASFGRGSEYAIFYACGNGIKENYTMKRPIKPCDIVPTLSQILSVSPTKNCEGAIIWDILY